MNISSILLIISSLKIECGRREMGEDNFILGTMGHCGFCLSGSSAIRSCSSSNHCLQYLDQYLKLNLSHILPRIGPTTIPEHLSRNFERVKLKVPLCQECGHLNEKFLKLYRQFEKIDMEMGFCAKLIHQKILEAEKPLLADAILGDQAVSMDGMRTRENLKVFRTEIIQKCSRKFSLTIPRVRVGNLRMKGAFKEKNKRRINSVFIGRQQDILPNPTQDALPVLEIDIGQVKVERSIDSMLDSDNYGSGNDSDSANDEDYVAEIHSTMLEKTRHSTDASEKRRSKKERAPVPNDNTSFVLVYPSTTTPQIEGPEQGRINPETGKYKCPICSSEFSRRQMCQKHYKSVHLKVRYKCTLCGKEFTQKGHYNIHHWNVHMGVRFNCDICSRSFAHRHHLKRHQQNKSCNKIHGPSYKTEHNYHCPICGKGSTTKWNLKMHLKEVHHETRQHGCNLCGKKFNRKKDLGSHQQQIHLSGMT